MASVFDSVNNLTGVAVHAYARRQARISNLLGSTPEARGALLDCSALGVRPALLEVLLVNALAHLETIRPWIESARKLKKPSPEQIKRLEGMRADLVDLDYRTALTIERAFAGHPYPFVNRTAAKSAAEALGEVIRWYRSFPGALADTSSQLGLPPKRLKVATIEHAVLGRLAATLARFFRGGEPHSEVVAVLIHQVLGRPYHAENIDRWRINFLQQLAPSAPPVRRKRRVRPQK